MIYAIRAALTTVVMVSFALPAKAHLPAPKVHNHAEIFLSYWNSHKKDPLQNQITQFKAKVFPAFSEFYGYKFESWKRAGKNPDEMLAVHLAEFPQVETAFQKKSQTIEIELADALIKFVSTFPDLKTDFDVHIVHSLGEMDGGIRTLNGKPTFIFGVDNILKYHHGATETAFFHHELFHKYHFQSFKGENKIWAALWGEGLATFASEALNPGSSLAELGLDVPRNLVRDCEVQKQVLFRYVLLNLDSDSEEIYEDLFLFSGKNPKIPRRAGYYLGYLIAKEMAKKHTLHQLARLDGPVLRHELETTLRRLMIPSELR